VVCGCVHLQAQIHRIFRIHRLTWIIFLQFSCGEFFLSYRFVLWVEGTTIQLWCGLTADSRLHIAMVWGRGSLVKLCRLKWINFYNPHTLCWRNTMLTLEWRRVLATHEEATAAITVIVDLNREDVWAKYRWNNATLCNVTVCWTAPCRWLAIPQGLSGSIQWLSLSPCEFGVSCWAVRHALVHDIVQSMGATIIARSLIPRSILRYRLIDMNPSPNTMVVTRPRCMQRPHITVNPCVCYNIGCCRQLTF